MILQGLKWMLGPQSPFHIKPRLDAELVRWGLLFGRSCSAEHTERAAPVLRDLTVKGRELFFQLAAKTGVESFDLRAEGLLNLCKTPEGLEHEVHGLARVANQVGIEARVLDARQTAALEPGVRFDIAGSVYFPFDAHLTPRKFGSALLDLAKKAGVRFHWRTSVMGWRAAADGRIEAVHTSSGEMAADAYVLAGGSWSPGMVRGLGVRLPMQAGKGYSLTIERPRFQLTKPVMLTERRIAVTPMGRKLRFGGTMELSGINEAIRPERVRQIIESVPHYLPDFGEGDFAGVKPWCGLRPVSPDGLPYIGRFGRHANLIAACGHAMLGLTMAPVTGLLVAEMFAGRLPSVPLEMLNPDRFA